MTAQDYRDHQNEQLVFREWFRANILKYDESSLSNAIITMSFSDQTPRYT